MANRQPKPKPTLLHLHSSRSFACLWALEELAANRGLEYGLETFPRWRNTPPKAVVDAFPLGKAPILTLDSDEVIQLKPGVLTETRLILNFLSETYGDGLWTPQSEGDRRRDVFFQDFADATFSTKCSYALLFDIIPMMLPPPFSWLVTLMISPIVNRFIADIRDILRVMEDALSSTVPEDGLADGWREEPEGPYGQRKPWFSGEKFGVADLSMSWGMHLASQRGYFDAGKFPNVANWFKRFAKRPAYKSAMQKAGPFDLLTFGYK